ncbi:MAG TPA: hypothetical protein VIM42_09430 [Clostridium sp.]
MINIYGEIAINSEKKEVEQFSVMGVDAIRITSNDEVDSIKDLCTTEHNH